MVLMIFIIIIYLAFYLYDRCLFAQDSYILCYRESYVKNGGDRPEELRSRASRQFGTKYFALRGHSFQTAEENNGIIMQGSAFLIPRAFGSGFSVDTGENLEYSVFCRGKIHGSTLGYQKISQDTLYCCQTDQGCFGIRRRSTGKRILKHEEPSYSDERGMESE
jgi:hypothetical protein